MKLLRRSGEEFYSSVTSIRAPLQWEYSNLSICSTVPRSNARQVCQSFQPVLNESPVDAGTWGALKEDIQTRESKSLRVDKKNAASNNCKERTDDAEGIECNGAQEIECKKRNKARNATMQETELRKKVTQQCKNRNNARIATMQQCKKRTESEI